MTKAHAGENMEKWIMSMRDQENANLCHPKRLLLWAVHIEEKKEKGCKKSSKSMELHCMLSNPPDFFLSFHHIAQLSKCRKLTLTDTVLEQAGYLLCKHMVFHFSPKSLISLTPFPKIVQPFAYLQCDNTAVWNNTLCSVYRWAFLICCCDKRKAVRSRETKGRQSQLLWGHLKTLQASWRITFPLKMVCDWHRKIRMNLNEVLFRKWCFTLTHPSPCFLYECRQTMF